MDASEQPPAARVRIATATVQDDPKPYTVHIRGGRHELTADEPLKRGGGDAGPNPTELLLSGLGACTAITLRMYAERKGWPIGRIHVRLGLIFHGDDREIEREIQVEGDLDEAQRARLQEIAEKTPVTRILKDGVRIVTDLR
jgi:putative redox protein